MEDACLLDEFCVCLHIYACAHKSVFFPFICVYIFLCAHIHVCMLVSGFGYADIENRLPCKPESVMRIASISKSITMAAVAKAVENGDLDLDKPVQFYVPNFPQKKVNGDQVNAFDAVDDVRFLSHKCLVVGLPGCWYCLVGLVVRRPPRERKIPGSNPACAGIFSWSSHTSDSKIGTPVATLPGAWRYRVSTGTGRPSVSIL